jgi:hypothetical protein
MARKAHGESFKATPPPIFGVKVLLVLAYTRARLYRIPGELAFAASCTRLKPLPAAEIWATAIFWDGPCTNFSACSEDCGNREFFILQ